MRPAARQTIPDSRPSFPSPIDGWAAARSVPQLFSVRACPVGWRVQGEAAEPVLFTTWAAAERQARRLALAVARTGTDAKVNVYDAQEMLVGCIQYYARTEARGLRSAAPEGVA